MRFIGGLCSFGIVATALAATISRNAIDPVFGLTYRPDQVQFDPAPPDLLAKCPGLTNAHWTRTLWIYAQASAPDRDDIVIGGFYAARPPAAPMLETDPKGAVIETTPTGCTLLGPAREVFQYPEGLIAQPALRALAADLVRRYRAAFGGNKALTEALRRQHVIPTAPRDAILREALAAGEK
jgi:hypothetical protein